MRTASTFVAALVLIAALPVAALRSAAGQESLVIEGDVEHGMDAGGESADMPGCPCRQAPPWHGSVAGEPCGPSCPPPTMFHANPCGQLRMKHTARQQGLVPPPCFPRLNGWLTDGAWPTPRPITMPRCPNCGAHIEQGL